MPTFAQQIGERISVVVGREKAKFFAARNRLSYPTLLNAMAGKTVPNGKFLSDFVSATGVDGTWLLTGVGSPEAGMKELVQKVELLEKVVRAVGRRFDVPETWANPGEVPPKP